MDCRLATLLGSVLTDQTDTTDGLETDPNGNINNVIHVGDTSVDTGVAKNTPAAAGAAALATTSTPAGESVSATTPAATADKEAAPASTEAAANNAAAIPDEGEKAPTAADKSADVNPAKDSSVTGGLLGGVVAAGGALAAGAAAVGAQATSAAKTFVAGGTAVSPEGVQAGLPAKSETAAADAAVVDQYKQDSKDLGGISGAAFTDAAKTAQSNVVDAKDAALAKADELTGKAAEAGKDIQVQATDAANTAQAKVAEGASTAQVKAAEGATATKAKTVETAKGLEKDGEVTSPEGIAAATERSKAQRTVSGRQKRRSIFGSIFGSRENTPEPEAVPPVPTKEFTAGDETTEIAPVIAAADVTDKKVLPSALAGTLPAEAQPAGLAGVESSAAAHLKEAAPATPAVATPAVATPAVATPAVATPAVATPAVATIESATNGTTDVKPATTATETATSGALTGAVTENPAQPAAPAAAAATTSTTSALAAPVATSSTSAPATPAKSAPAVPTKETSKLSKKAPGEKKPGFWKKVKKALS